MLDALIPIGHRLVLGTGVIQFRHAVCQSLKFLLHVAQVIEHRHALGEDRSSREREAVLRQISRRDPLGDSQRAIVKRVHPGKSFHQGGLSGPVAADHTDVIAVGDQPVDIFEKKFMAEAFSGAGKLNHGTAIIVAGGF